MKQQTRQGKPCKTYASPQLALQLGRLNCRAKHERTYVEHQTKAWWQTSTCMSKRCRPAQLNALHPSPHIRASPNSTSDQQPPKHAARHRDKTTTHGRPYRRHGLNAPFSNLLAFVQHYLHCKQLAPAQTTACILIPGYLLKPLRSILTGMRLLNSFRNATVKVLNCLLLLTRTASARLCRVSIGLSMFILTFL